jgi:hypothetical protein
MLPLLKELTGRPIVIRYCDNVEMAENVPAREIRKFTCVAN